MLRRYLRRSVSKPSVRTWRHASSATRTSCHPRDHASSEHCLHPRRDRRIRFLRRSPEPSRRWPSWSHPNSYGENPKGCQGRPACAWCPASRADRHTARQLPSACRRRYELRGNADLLNDTSRCPSRPWWCCHYDRVQESTNLRRGAFQASEWRNDHPADSGCGALRTPDWPWCHWSSLA